MWRGEGETHKKEIVLELCGSERLCARVRVREREQREGKEGVKAWMISSSLLRPSVCAEETRPEGEKERGFHKDVFLGKGTYGAVWRVTKKDTGKVYAMKTVDMRNKKQSEKCVVWWMEGSVVCCVFSRVCWRDGMANNREDAVNEIRILASVRHPNIIRFRESFIENDTLFIVCLLCTVSGVCNVCVCFIACVLFLVVVRLSRSPTLPTRRTCLWSSRSTRSAGPFSQRTQSGRSSSRWSLGSNISTATAFSTESVPSPRTDTHSGSCLSHVHTHTHTCTCLILSHPQCPHRT